MQDTLNLSRILAVAMIPALFTYAPRPASSATTQDAERTAQWQSDVEYAQLGKGDLNRAYFDLLDYLLPRQPRHPHRWECSYVLRYVPRSGAEHQLNIWQAEGSNELNIQSFELPAPLASRLRRAEDAQRLAKETQVTTRDLRPSPHFLELIHQIQEGVSVPLSPAVVIHGDNYRLWASCGLARLEVDVTLPGNTETPLSKWMNHVWSSVRDQQTASTHRRPSGRE